MKEHLVTCLELQLAFPTVWLSIFDEAIFTLHYMFNLPWPLFITIIINIEL